MNEYDYNKMISDFDSSTRYHNNLNKIHQHWLSINRRHRRTITRMKQEREDQYLKKLDDLSKRQRLKEQTLLTALNEVNKLKSLVKQRSVGKLIEREAHAKHVVEANLTKHEAQRLLAAEKTTKKIERFKERNLRIKEEHHDAVVKKNFETETKHNANIRLMNEENEKIEKENEHKAFMKYVNFFFRKKRNKEGYKELMRRSQERLEMKELRLQEIEQQQEVNRKTFIKRMKDKELKKEEIDKEKANEHERRRMLSWERFERVKHNKEEAMKVDKMIRNEVIKEQVNKLIRGCKIEDIVNKRRINAK